MLKNVFRKKEKNGNRLTKSSSHDLDVPASNQSIQSVKPRRSKTASDLHELKDQGLRRKNKKKKRGKSLKIDTAISMYQLSDYVKLSTGQKGYIRYIGKVNFDRGQWYCFHLFLMSNVIYPNEQRSLIYTGLG